jgi:fido (protein-threonine AMPylation protein)
MRRATNHSPTLAEPAPPFRGIDWDDALEQRVQARLALGRGQARVEWWIAERSTTTLLSLDIIQGFHRVLFADTWPDFAGRLRGPDAGQIATNVSFGNYRGTRFEEVPGACEALSAELTKLIHQLDDALLGLERDDLRAEVARVAAYAHCQLISIHPFVNGNGRTSRACVNYFMARYGFLPLSYARPQSEYLDATRTYLQHRIIDHFADYLLSLMVPANPSEET